MIYPKSVSEELDKYRGILIESWDKPMHTAKKDKGMFKGKSKEEIGSSLSKNKKRAKKLHSSDKPEPESLKKKIKQQEFALRAKNNFGKVSESFESPLYEGIKFESLLKQYHADIDAFIEGEQMSEPLYDALYEYYFEEMPYGVAKGRTGDPYQWVNDHFQNTLEREGLLGGTEITTNGLENTEFSNSNLGEGKTTRKCKGKGCVKKCADGKSYCSKKCQGKIDELKEGVEPGPFSRNGEYARKLKK